MRVISQQNKSYRLCKTRIFSQKIKYKDNHIHIIPSLK